MADVEVEPMEEADTPIEINQDKVEITELADDKDVLLEGEEKEEKLYKFPLGRIKNSKQ